MVERSNEIEEKKEKEEMVEKVNKIEDKNEKDEIGRVSINEEK